MYIRILSVEEILIVSDLFPFRRFDLIVPKRNYVKYALVRL